MNIHVIDTTLGSNWPNAACSYMYMYMYMYKWYNPIKVMKNPKIHYNIFLNVQRDIHTQTSSKHAWLITSHEKHMPCHMAHWSWLTSSNGYSMPHLCDLWNAVCTGLISRRNNFANFAFGSNLRMFFMPNL